MSMMHDKGHIQSSHGSRPSSSTNRPPSATHKTHYKQVSSTSNVDETLFSSPELLQDASFPAPWEKKKKSKRPLLWSPSPRDTTPRPRTPLKREYHKVKFKPSYCDETLFGPKLLGADWAAPWEKKEHKSKPLVFDTTFTATRGQALDSARLDSQRPGSARPTSGRPGSRSQCTPTPRPPWK